MSFLLMTLSRLFPAFPLGGFLEADLNLSLANRAAKEARFLEGGKDTHSIAVGFVLKHRSFTSIIGARAFVDHISSQLYDFCHPPLFPVMIEQFFCWPMYLFLAPSPLPKSLATGHRSPIISLLEVHDLALLTENDPPAVLRPRVPVEVISPEPKIMSVREPVGK